MAKAVQATFTKAPIDLQLNENSKMLLAKLGKYAKSVSLKNTMRAIGISYRKEVKAIFERKQVRSPELKWDPLAPSTQREKEKKGYGDKGILERRGVLKKSMTVENAKGNINRYGHSYGMFGSSIPYGVYHDNLDEPRKQLPLRNFSQPSESTFLGWINTLNSDLKNQLKRIGVNSD